MATSRKAVGAARIVALEDLEPAPVVLVVGGEAVLAERAVAVVTAAARRADPELVVETIDAAAYEAGRLALLTSPSLFGGGTLIVVQGVEAANEAFVPEAGAYLAAPDPAICLVLRHSGGARAKPLLDAARALGAPEVSCQPITKDEDKIEFATAEFRRLGRRASPQAVRALVDAVGSDLRELAAACHQLASDADLADAVRSEPQGAGESRIEASVVEEWFGGRVEVTGFRVADAAVGGRAEQALSLLRHALATGADPVPLVAAIAAKIRIMAKVSVAGRGRSIDVAAGLKAAPWQVDRARRDLNGWTEEGLARAIVALAEADTAVKGGGRDPVYAVERAVLTVAEARGA